MTLQRLVDRLGSLAEIRTIDWLRYVGVLVWLLTALPLIVLPWLLPETPETGRIVGWWSAALLFLLVLWHPVVGGQRTAPFWKRVTVMLILSISAFGVTHFTHTGLGSLLAMLVAALLPWILPLLVGMVWVVCLALAFSVWIVFSPEGSWLLLLVYLLMNLGLTSFPFIASLLALKQMQARAELRRVNSELLATQSLLTENTRIAERVRISRELHDLVGHHLTALTLNLEVASHTSEGKPREHVDQAASIARLLLADVREVVSDMRRDDEVDFKHALETLAAGVPDLDIHLDIPPDLAQTDPKRAQILLRCAQELITNTVRHARAGNLWISLSGNDEGLVLKVRDDGCGTPNLVPGNGIGGMRERLRELGGRLDIATRPGAGFQVKAWLPMEQSS
ncbi:MULTISPECIES: sensor histidine kinase [unclassified Wenzhouxiangella]|uniref:sensor histidine kinase n=1 Tax=unclassified Wenzhouxiangella TaxID=2613841 RepID=UPI000E3262AC|nr:MULTISPECIES: sensor histidine kinase [unclassified Wenzhouxiangella]RFF28113.1 sensor histidine kinase [Wenzhouxiangella sp. 15181]RFP68090.1 sensor histidine kinase [Wenzhouxiangella sp. 15190]